jgi:hypothetical protein
LLFVYFSDIECVVFVKIYLEAFGVRAGCFVVVAKNECVGRKSFVVPSGSLKVRSWRFGGGCGSFGVTTGNIVAGI